MEEIKKVKEFFALILLIVLFGLIYKAWLILYIGFAIGMSGLLFSRVLRIVSNIWGNFSSYLGIIMGTLILAVVYFLILTPVAFLYRFFNQDALSLKPTKAASTFVSRNLTYAPEDLENPW